MSGSRLSGEDHGPTGVWAGALELPLQNPVWRQCWFLPIYDDSELKSVASPQRSELDFNLWGESSDVFTFP